MVDYSPRDPLPILEARLDWVTATVKAGKALGVLASRADAIMSIREKEGYRRRGFRSPFYQGETIDGCTWGTREDDGMIRLSGELAGRFGPTAITFANHISRLDVQVTLRDPDLTRNWAERADWLAGQNPKVQAGELETRCIRQRPDGITSYIGAPASQRMLRCYDKAAESKGEYPLGSWRWEVEYKHDRAHAAARRLQSKSFRPQDCLDQVCKAYASVGISLPTVCVPSGWRDAAIKHESDDARRLAWIIGSIRPMLERMKEGYETSVLLDALGFSEVIDTLESQAATIDSLSYLVQIAPGLDNIGMKKGVEVLQ